jgi:steroid delta-isomerase-like uncharacterized protein
MSAQENAALARRIYEAFNKKDLDACLALATEDVRVVLTPFNQTFQGRAGFRDFMTGFARAFPDLTITITHQVATDGEVVNECTWRGTHTGPLATPSGDVPPTGKAVEGAIFCEVWGIRDGNLASHHNYHEVSSWLRPLGLEH